MLLNPGTDLSRLPSFRNHEHTASVSLFKQAAEHCGLERVFLNPGTSEMWLVAALDVMAAETQADSVRFPPMHSTLCLHENVCTGAADGYFRMARKPAGVVVHLGPGLANGLSNLHNARRARSPILCIVGQMSSWHIDADSLLHSNIPSLASYVSSVVVCPHLRRDGQSPSTNTPANDDMARGSKSSSSGSGQNWRLHDWLSSQGEVWAVLNGQPRASKAAKDGSDGAAADGSRPVTGRKSLGGHWHSPGVSDGKNLVTKAGSSEPLVEVITTIIEDTPGSRIVTLVVPHDLTWEPMDLPHGFLPRTPSVGPPEGLIAPVAEDRAPFGTIEAFARACAQALRGVGRGEAALFLGGEALLEAGGALHAAGLVAAATGSNLLCETFFARVDRGAGRASPERLIYFPTEAQKALNKHKILVFIDASLPVAMFGYKDGLSRLVQLPKEAIWQLDTQTWGSGSAAAMLKAMASELKAAEAAMPGENCGGVFMKECRPPMPPASSKLNAPLACKVIAHLQPRDAVMVDEGLTSTGTYWQDSKGCPPFSHLTITGGAIGSGPALALGAALACPDGSRRVINIQADGSAMYGLQALWSQAREKAKVTTIICANNSYAILKVECLKQEVPNPGCVTQAHTDLKGPELDWCNLAEGQGVPSARATTCGELATALEKALQVDGPFLIEACLA